MYRVFGQGCQYLVRGFAAFALAGVLSFPALAEDDSTLRIEADDLLEWNQDAGVYTASGNAVATQGDAKISGDLLVATYDPESEERSIEKITGTGNVTFVDSQGNARGQKIIYNIDGSGYQVTGPSALVEGKNGIISADSQITLVTRADDSQHMTATGNAVYINADNERFSGDLINAYFNAEGTLQRIEGEGSVDVRTSEGNTASGDSLVYLAETEKATLVGDVSVSDGKSTMQGGRAEVDFISGNSRLLSDEKNGRVRGVLITK
ncbi:MAG: LptA/OstA family protein [Candidatus Puniceispirillaceae bacterium]